MGQVDLSFDEKDLPANQELKFNSIALQYELDNEKSGQSE